MHEDVSVKEVDGQVEVSVSPKENMPEESERTLASIKGFLGIDKPESDEVGMLKEIHEHVLGELKDGDKESRSAYLMAIRHLEERLTPPKSGQTRLSVLHRYVTSVKSVREAEKERDVYLR
jgi:hypothetical protein